jgi:hypothetical protein
VRTKMTREDDEIRFALGDETILKQVKGFSATRFSDHAVSKKYGVLEEQLVTAVTSAEAARVSAALRPEPPI